MGRYHAINLTYQTTSSVVTTRPPIAPPTAVPILLPATQSILDHILNDRGIIPVGNPDPDPSLPLGGWLGVPENAVEVDVLLRVIVNIRVVKLVVPFRTKVFSSSMLDCVSICRSSS